MPGKFGLAWLAVVALIGLACGPSAAEMDQRIDERVQEILAQTPPPTLITFPSPAATAGATFVSPFVGRLDDAGQDGMEVVRESVDIFDQYHLPTQVLAASLRHPRHVTEAAQLGAQIATLPYAVLKAMVKHPLTDVGIERFLADSKAYEKETART